jgi:hypothetical protein
MMTMSGPSDGVHATLDHRSHRSASALSSRRRTVRQRAPEIRSGCERGRKNVSANGHTSGSVSECVNANGNPNANETGKGLTLV